MNSTLSNAEASSPLALIRGEPLTEVPGDLYIPPEALTLSLELFSGPMDLLIYLIKKQNIDILDIPISLIADQYARYLEAMDTLRYELAGDYLLMAVLLAEIKAKMLLPQQESDQEEDLDPRAELVRHIIEYERYRTASEQLDALPRLERDFYLPTIEVSVVATKRSHPDISFDALHRAMLDVQVRTSFRQQYQISQETLTIRDCTAIIIQKLKRQGTQSFLELIDSRHGTIGIALTFFTLLMLAHQKVVALVQKESLGPIEINLLVANYSIPAAPFDHI